MHVQQSQALVLCHKLLKRRGYRITTGREAVVSVLAAAGMGEHLSAEEIYIKVHSSIPAVGLTSVYRTLDLLTNLGVVSKFDFGDGRARYELAEGTRGVTHHHHLVCTGCGTIIDYDDFIDDELSLIRRTEKGLAKKFGFKINGHVIQFLGLCADCNGKGGEEPSGSTMSQKSSD
ncbi:MAG: Fur family transcriptional regulator [Desulfomonile sp.]